MTSTHLRAAATGTGWLRLANAIEDTQLTSACGVGSNQMITFWLALLSLALLPQAHCRRSSARKVGLRWKSIVFQFTTLISTHKVLEGGALLTDLVMSEALFHFTSTIYRCYFCFLLSCHQESRTNVLKPL